MSENENDKPTKPVYAVYTDDSGVVISQKEYAANGITSTAGRRTIPLKKKEK